MTTEDAGTIVLFGGLLGTKHHVQRHLALEWHRVGARTGSGGARPAGAVCFAFLGPVVGSVSVLSNASGRASISLAIPSSVVHAGSNLMHQALSLFGPLCATNATELRVGR